MASSWANPVQDPTSSNWIVTGTNNDGTSAEVVFDSADAEELANQYVTYKRGGGSTYP